MIFFIFSIVALLCWTGSDMFTKMGTNQNNKYSQWYVVLFVGIIMTIHAIISVIGGCFINEELTPKWICSIFYTDFKLVDLIHYFPVAFIYILAMVVGYMGLRYIELSISSPICNSSGSLALLVCVLLGWAKLDIWTIIGVSLITIGIISLGFVEYFEDDEIKLVRQDKSKFKYTKSFIAILLPIIYLILDAMGTVGDQMIFELGLFELSDYASNTAFEITFGLFAIFAFIFLKIKKQNVFINKDENGTVKIAFSKYLIFAGICETVGQIFYMAVMFSTFDAGMPIISSYCVMSVILSRIFLKEKLSFKHYIAITLTLVGIILLGIFSSI